MRLKAAAGRQFCREILVQLKVPETEAETVAEVLVDSNLRGIDSHGLRILPIYVQRIQAGQIRPGSPLEIVQETPTTARLNGNQNFGYVIGCEVAQRAISKAQEHGLGAVNAFNITHCGAISYYALQVAEKKLVGLCVTNSTPRVAPYGGRTGLHGTNPLAYAIPVEGHEPLVFDCATGHSAAKLLQAAAQGQPIPEGVGVTREGDPTNDPKAALAGWLLPVAGPIGYGLGLLVDVLSGALGGCACGPEVPPVTDLTSPYGTSFFLLALDPARFVPYEVFQERVNFLIRSARQIPPQEGFTAVRVPGERGFREKEERLREGIPFPEKEWPRLLRDLEELGVEVGAWRESGK